MIIDENAIFRSVTLKVTSSLDMGEALVNTRAYLQGLMPLDELILFRVDSDLRRIHQILRVTAEGVIGEPDQLLFLIDEEKERIAKDKFGIAPQDLEAMTVLTAEDIRVLDFADPMSVLGISEAADLLVLNNPDLRAGLVLLCYREHAYEPKHVALLKLLKDPFDIALSNALRYIEIQKSRDDLQDENVLFREATIRLTGGHDIGSAFHKTLCYLTRFLPLEELILITMNKTFTEHRLLLRVSEKGVIDEGVAIALTDGFTAEKRSMVLEQLPDTFVEQLHSTSSFMPSSDELRDDAFVKLGISPQASIIVLGVKPARAAVVFVSQVDHAFTDRHLEVLKTLQEPFVIALHNATRFYEIERLKNRLEEDNQALQREIQREVGDRVVGMHQGLKQVMTLATQVSKTPSPVLLMGETGSGKEVIATAIHRLSDRSTGPFIGINCGAIPESLIDSELFGHEKGAFTGANERTRGRFERADGGTLFLDEVGELPLSAQVKLLRVLQEKELERVGGGHTIQVDVRLIAATNRDLPSMVRNGKFREDLWFRLNVFPIEIPPLRKRRQDIPALAYHFVETKSRQLNLPTRPPLPPESLEQLVAYDWPGNVRELQNAIERALILSRGNPLSFPHLEPTDSPTKTSAAYAAVPAPVLTFDETVATYLRALLETTGGRIAGPKGAAARAGLNASTFRSKLKKYGVMLPWNSDTR